MAARNFAPLRCLQRDAVLVFGGGTGAAVDPLTAIVGKTGFAATAPFDQTGTGLYTVTLRDKYASLLYFDGIVIDATTPGAWAVVVVSETVATDGKINIAIFKGGALTDLTTDEKLRVMVALSNTSQTPS